MTLTDFQLEDGTCEAELCRSDRAATKDTPRTRNYDGVEPMWTLPTEVEVRSRTAGNHVRSLVVTQAK